MGRLVRSTLGGSLPFLSLANEEGLLLGVLTKDDTPLADELLGFGDGIGDLFEVAAFSSSSDITAALSV